MVVYPEKSGSFQMQEKRKPLFYVLDIVCVEGILLPKSSTTSDYIIEFRRGIRVRSIN